MREQMVLENRAWLGPDSVSPGVTLKDGKIIGMTPHFSIKNFGRSPALDVRVTTAMLTVLEDMDVEDYYAKNIAANTTGSANVAVIFPELAIVAPMIANKPFDWDSINRGSIHMYLVSVVEYSTVSGSRHTTRTCYRLNVKAGSLEPYRQMNDAN